SSLGFKSLGRTAIKFSLSGALVEFSWSGVRGGVSTPALVTRV
ncbi:hypothetical protein LINPERPRIM_LOCUS30416, partial [Linum perenne]